MRTGLILWLIGAIFTTGFLTSAEYEERDWDGVLIGQAIMLIGWIVLLSLVAWPYFLGSRLGERLRPPPMKPNANTAHLP